MIQFDPRADLDNQAKAQNNGERRAFEFFAIQENLARSG
jgi:hypothetical protein